MSLYIAFVILHVIGTCLGAGAATVSDMLFFTFAKDGKIDKREYESLKAVSRVVWLGLLLLIVTGIGFLVLLNNGLSTAEYNMSKVAAKMIIVLIVLLNGIAMHRVVLPFIKKNIDKPLYSAAIMNKSKVILTAGAISVVSWYSALILGAWRGLSASFTTIFGMYLIVLVIAIIVSNIMGALALRYLKASK